MKEAQGEGEGKGKKELAIKKKKKKKGQNEEGKWVRRNNESTSSHVSMCQPMKKMDLP